MVLPVLTAEQRQAALDKAAQARTARAMLRAALKSGTTGLEDVLARSDAGDEIVSKTKVLAVVTALPGIGPVRARQVLGKAGIAENRRVGGLGARQRAALLTALTRD